MLGSNPLEGDMERKRERERMVREGERPSYSMHRQPITVTNISKAHSGQGHKSTAAETKRSRGQSRSL